MKRGIFWFRHDLRLSDNPALERACKSHDALLLVYVDDAASKPYTATRAWLRKSLDVLSTDVQRAGGTLHVLAGDPEVLIPALAKSSGASAVHIAALHEPEAHARDTRISASLAEQGVAMLRAAGRLLTDADQVRSKTDAPYRVFTPFLKTALPTWRYRPRPAPEQLTCLGLPADLAHLQAIIAPPSPAWDSEFWTTWQPGEANALRRLHGFLDHLDDYPDDRDCPGIDGTSRMSPYLHFGEISPGKILEAARARGGTAGFLVWGDPSLYDSTIRIVEQLAQRLPIDYDVLPGISAPQLLAARHRIVLHTVGAALHVTTARRLHDDVAAGQTNLVVMLNRSLELAGLEDWSIWWGANLGTDSEELVCGRVGDVLAELDAARSRAKQAAGWVMDLHLLRAPA